jgi:hypothetical protein
MKRQELHLLNRIYIYPPGKKILPYYGDVEDVINPEKVIATLQHLDMMEYDETKQNAILKLHLPKLYKDTIHRDTLFVMTKQREMFQSLKDLNYKDEEAILDWLIHYWQVAFLMTFPVYTYQHSTFTFNLKKMVCEEGSFNYDYFIQNGFHTIGNGFTLLLSLNTAGWISNDIAWNVIHRFIEKIDYDECMFDIHHQWVMYYHPQYMHIGDFPFLYAFQYCHPMIYQLLYRRTTTVMCFFNNNNENFYFSSVFTAPLDPKKHHYEFLKNSKQSLLCIQRIYCNFHFNIHQRLLAILQSSSSFKQFLSNGLNRRFLIHCIHKNKRLGLLKFIQSISYLYHNSSYSKRYLKWIWRTMMKEFKASFVKVMHIYLLEYFLLESNAKPSYSLLCPPLKMLRDIMYLLKDYFSLHKKITFSMIIAKKHQSFLDTELFQMPQDIHSTHNKYILNTSFLQLLKLIKPYHSSMESYLNNLNKKGITLLQCCHKKSHEVYQVMQNYYIHHPDALWRV